MLSDSNNAAADVPSPKTKGGRKANKSPQRQEVIGNTAVVEGPNYNEVVANSSAAPVVHEVPSTTTVLPGDAGPFEKQPVLNGTRGGNAPQLDCAAFPTIKEVADLTKQQELLNAKSNAPASGHGLLPKAFVNRVASIPAVAETVHILTDSVDNVAKRNRVAKMALDTTKKTVSLGVSIAEKFANPVKPVFGGVAEKIDNRATDLLEKGLNKYPIINKQPGEIASQVKYRAYTSADATAHKILSYKGISYVVGFGARTLLNVNRGVDNVVHEQVCSRVDRLATGVLSILQESQQQPTTVAVA